MSWTIEISPLGVGGAPDAPDHAPDHATPGARHSRLRTLAALVCGALLAAAALTVADEVVGDGARDPAPLEQAPPAPRIGLGDFRVPTATGR
ncbi:hypothetical protein [Isoptericola sp. NPDC058082]|uniref:hypothetical protein n=1 Tax=Isoptericola sp. NPDC058082 TaxID=3346331 RepID=UPI0036E8000E